MKGSHQNFESNFRFLTNLHILNTLICGDVFWEVFLFFFIPVNF